MAFQKKVEQVYLSGENICPPNKIVQNGFDIKNIVIDIYEYCVKIIFQTITIK